MVSDFGLILFPPPLALANKTPFFFFLVTHLGVSDYQESLENLAYAYFKQMPLTPSENKQELVSGHRLFSPVFSKTHLHMGAFLVYQSTAQ